MRTLATALGRRRTERGTTGRPILVPLAGGAASLLCRSARPRLVSLLEPQTVDPGRGGLAGRLERRQARRSAMILVPDRGTGVRFAMRWRLDLARIRVVDDVSDPDVELVERQLTSSARRQSMRPWHSR